MARVPRSRARVTPLALLPLALGLAACGSAPDPVSGPPTVVATTSVLADVAGRIATCADPQAQVTSLMPLGADPHDFAPSSEQVARMAQADLVIASGLGLESGLTDALAAVAADGGRVLELGPELEPIEATAADDHGDGHGDDHGHDHGADDPHWWMDMSRMATAAGLIGATLAEATGSSAYEACGEQEAASIRAAEEGVRATLASVPEARRVLVTDHESLGYLAAAYGYRIAGTVVPSGSTLAEPSSADLAALAATIRAEAVPAIFANASSPTALAEAVAAETGTDVTVVPLLIESLGQPGSPGGTYVGMMASNADAIAGALTGR